MKRNCKLEVRLVPPSDSFNPSSSATSDDTQYHHSKMEIFNGKSSSTEQQKQMTIFFKGQMAVSHVTELQARAIIHQASREMEERLSSPLNNSSSPSPSPSPSPTTPLMQPHNTPSPTGLSMKRSLQRFLQKRNNRVQAASPYYHH